MKNILVTGAGGFIGHALTTKLVELGHNVIGVDLKKPEFSPTQAQHFFIRDLRFQQLVEFMDEWPIDEIYHLAADMGGIGFITASLADVARNNTQIHLNVLESARKFGKPELKLCFSSTACVLARYKQASPDVVPLTEDDDFPYDPEPGYGFEKLYMEQLLAYYRKDYGLNSRIVRFHNCYGADGTWRGGREKAPAAVCRKIAELPAEGGEVTVWGDGLCTRSFMHVDDCVEGLMRIVASDYHLPLNLGRDELISVDGLYDLVADIAGKKITKIHDMSQPQGVRGRNADCTRLKNTIGWVPGIDLRAGLERTYPWIVEQVKIAKLAGAKFE